MNLFNRMSFYHKFINNNQINILIINQINYPIHNLINIVINTKNMIFVMSKIKNLTTKNNNNLNHI
jgi:hypothetical protein